MLDALEKTLKKYITKNKDCEEDCAFCLLDAFAVRGCEACPWKIFTDMTCGDYLDEKYTHECNSFSWNQLWDGESKRWRSLRIRQLRVWISVYKLALKSFIK